MVKNTLLIRDQDGREMAMEPILDLKDSPFLTLVTRGEEIVDLHAGDCREVAAYLVAFADKADKVVPVKVSEPKPDPTGEIRGY